MKIGKKRNITLSMDSEIINQLFRRELIMFEKKLSAYIKEIEEYHPECIKAFDNLCRRDRQNLIEKLIDCDSVETALLTSTIPCKAMVGYFLHSKQKNKGGYLA